MAKTKLTLMNKLPLEWDTKRIHELIENVTTEAGFVDSEGKIKEPFGSIIFLKLVGRMPVRTTLIFNSLSRKENKITRSELAKVLGFTEGSSYVRLGEWLNHLVKLGLLEEYEIRSYGKRKTKAFKLREMELHRFCENLHALMSGRKFEWSLQHLLRAVKQRYEKVKVEDFDGTRKHLDPTELINSIIRSGESLEVAIDITERILEKRDQCRSTSHVIKMIMKELGDRKSWKSMENYMKKNPIGIKIVGGDYDDKLLTYGTAKKILLKHLSSFGITSLPSDVCKEVLHPTLRSFMSDIKLERTVDEKQVIDKIKSGIFSVYRETLEDITQNPLKCVEKSRNFLESAREKAKIEKGNEAMLFLLSSFHWLMKSLYVRWGLLPAKDERATVFLTRNILSSDFTGTGQEQIEPKEAGKKIRNRLRRFLQSEETTLGDLQKCLESILLDPGTDQSPIRKHDVDFLLAFIERLISIIARPGSPHRTHPT